ncbi:MAG: ADP-ribosylglycohydrolase family protein [Bacillota bacterium]
MGHLSDIALSDRIRGGLLGLACGDALGAAVEFMTRDAIRRRYGRVTEMVGGGPFGVEPGEGTDDTDMALAVAEGLVEGAPDAREAVGRRLVAWFERGPKDVGSATRVALSNYLACRDWDATVARTRVRLRDMAAGNGSLVRTLPVSFAFLRDPQRMRRESRRLSEMTHPHELPTIACVYYNELARELALGAARERAAESARRAVESEQLLVSYSTRTVFLRHIDKVPALSYSEVRASGFVLDALVAALWVFLRADGFEDAVMDAVGLGDDADSIGALVGGLAGTYWGASAIPERWLAVLKARGRIEAVAQRLVELASR